MRRLIGRGVLTAICALASAICTLAGVTGALARVTDWPVFGHDPARSGAANDTRLTPRTVAKLQVRWHIMLGAVADSAPIIVGDRVFVTRRDGVTVAIDAADGHTVWTYATNGPQITSSVPAYDAVGQALYAPGVDGAVHKLDPATGHELHENGFPVAITRAPQTEKDASSLNVDNGYLYAQTSGYIGDATPYVGHVVAIHLSDGETHVFNVLCSTRRTLIAPQSCAAQRAGMWSRAGVVVDPEPSMHGRVYVATGNGPFDARAGNYGDTILSLTADASRLIGSLTPDDYAELEARDLDIGSSSPALLPRQRDSATPLLAVQGGKDGVLRLFDRAHLGGLAAPLQKIALGNELFSAPAVWTDAHGTTFVFVALSDGVHAYRVTTTKRTTRLVPAWDTELAARNQGTSPVIDGGVLFVATNGDLIALDAQTGHRLWGHALGPIHWESPVIANGVVYCTDETGALTAFALPAPRD
jgi:outer membrane protein assembly factor BamB